MTTIDDGRDATLLEILELDRRTADAPQWLRRLDAWATRAGDAVNPILVKETRQALKSRQFVVTFSLLLFASFAWTAAGSLMMMPQIYYVPSGPALLTGYYLVLAVPMLLVVPLAAYRSLEAEVDDGTLELLTVTALSPLQIVLGKLAGAGLQMLLYFTALFPCVAYAYTLRGIDLPTLLLLIGTLGLAGPALTIAALFFAPVSPGRTGQIVGLLALISLLVAAQFAIGNFSVSLIQAGNPLDSGETMFLAGSAVVFVVSAAAILLVATAAKLTPESENRSTKIRVAVLLHTACVIGIAAVGSLGDAFFEPQALPLFACFYLTLFWTPIGAMAASESAAMTPRIRRELPSTFLGRLLGTWLTPGPATGVVFAVATLGCCFAVLFGLLLYVVVPMQAWQVTMIEQVRTFFTLVVCYLAFAWVAVRGMVAFLRTRGPVKVSVGIASVAVVLLLMAAIPYAIGLYLNDYRPYAYSEWQFLNWLWTLEQSMSGTISPLSFGLAAGLGGIAFFGHLLLLGRRVLPLRLATPRRVEEEYRRLSGLSSETGEEIDPLGLGSDASNP